VVANEAPELEDGFERASTKDAREDTPGLRPAWLLPARWTPTTPALPRDAKKVIPRGSVANLLLSQQHLGSRPHVDHEPIDSDYSPSTNPPDSPPDSPLPRPVRDHRKMRGGKEKIPTPSKTTSQ
jgi:hypothetical protein